MIKTEVATGLMAKVMLMDKKFQDAFGTAYMLKTVIVNGKSIYCLADNSGRILNTSEVNDIFIKISTFYKDIPKVDEVVAELNKKLEKEKAR